MAGLVICHGWHVIRGPDLNGHWHQHNMPDQDLIEHVPSLNCACNPIEDNEVPDCWDHNALDGRLDYEMGFRKPH